MWERTWRVKNGKQVCRWKPSKTFSYWMYTRFRSDDAKHKAIEQANEVIGERLYRLVQRKKQMERAGLLKVSSKNPWWRAPELETRYGCKRGLRWL